MNDCPKNCGCKGMIIRNKDDIQILFKAVNTIKNWVIAGMATLVINLGLSLLKLIIH